MDDMASPLIEARGAAATQRRAPQRTDGDAAGAAARPPLWAWQRTSGLSLGEVARRLEVSKNLVFLWLLPWNDPRRSPPSADHRAAIETLTDGAVRADRDWTPPAGDGAAQQDRWAG